MTPSAPRLEQLADDAWLLVLGDRIDSDDNRRVHALSARIGAAAPEWLRDTVPAYASLAVFFDPALARAEHVRHWLETVARDDAHPAAKSARTVEVPVAYGSTFGADLEDVARLLGVGADTVIARHTAGDYTVAMIGFAPGFPYLSGLDPALTVPRLATPRTGVPAGSVGIGGAQTGIYPREGPGGWRLIGRTPLSLFDPDANPPARLQPGDRVRFRAIDAEEFRRLEQDT